MKLKAERETGFGAGVLFIAADTGRALWVKRSDQGDFAGHWCCGGGGVEDNETIEQAVRREVREELGYSEPYELQHMHRTRDKDFIYHNHIAVVPTEFTPVLNAEHSAYVWADTAPSPAHPKLIEAINAYTARNK